MFLILFERFGMNQAVWLASKCPPEGLECERMRAALEEHIKKAQPV
jgi:hypothetical protein